MKLWIRSQERDTLQECTQLSVVPIITANKKHATWGVVANFGRAGEYSTRERCIEIIDEIQCFISFDKNVCTFTESGGGRFVYEDKVSCVIYTMPQK